MSENNSIRQLWISGSIKYLVNAQIQREYGEKRGTQADRRLVFLEFLVEYNIEIQC